MPDAAIPPAPRAVISPLRDRMVPMITDALGRVPLLGLVITGWEFNTQITEQGPVAYVIITVRGVDLAGPMKEIGRPGFFDTWQPTQKQVDRVVWNTVEQLREFRAGLVREGNGRAPK